MKDTGGPAFPETHVLPIMIQEQVVQKGWKGREGMTLRDWFAGQIIMGNIARAKPGYEFSSNKELAKLSYEMADAMLKAREEGTND